MMFDSGFTAPRLTRLSFLDCVLRTILSFLCASLPDIWISHENDNACLYWSWIHVCLWLPYQVSVTSHAFAKRAATYIALLRDLLFCASLFPPTTSGEHTHAAWLSSFSHCMLKVFLDQIKNSHWKTLILAGQPPSLYIGHNVLWYGISLQPVWVSCPGHALSQLFVHLLIGRTWDTEKSLTYSKHCSVTTKTSVILVITLILLLIRPVLSTFFSF